MDTSRHLNEHYAFDGYTNTRIVFMSNGVTVWNMTILDDETVYATTDTTGKEETFTKFPLKRIFFYLKALVDPKQIKMTNQVMKMNIRARSAS
jgi:hypothetical protein